MPENAGSGVAHFLPFYILWATSGTGIIILFLSLFFHASIPVVGGPRLYGARQVGSKRYHTKVMMTCVSSHCDLRNCLKVPFPLLGSKPAVGPMSEAQQGVNIYRYQISERGLGQSADKVTDREGVSVGVQCSCGCY